MYSCGLASIIHFPATFNAIYCTLQGKSASNLDIAQLEFEFFGGRKSDVFDENVTHVILDIRSEIEY